MIVVLMFSFSFTPTATDRMLLRELGEWHNEVTREIDSRFSLYHFPVIRDATGNFSEENKLGRGSFGFVYRVGSFSVIFVMTDIGCNLVPHTHKQLHHALVICSIIPYKHCFAVQVQVLSYILDSSQKYLIVINI